MQILNAQTESNVLVELTYLNADVSSGGSSLTVENGDGFSTDDYIIIERLGAEQAELTKIATVSGTTITLSSVLSFDHKDGIKVQKILYNQRYFYSCTTESGTFARISGGTNPKDIEVDRPDGTFFEHTDGTSATWYKATYYNEVTTIETSLDDAIAAQGSESNHYTSLYAVRKQSGFEDAFGISDEVISDYRAEAENEFESRIATIYSTPLSSKPKVGRQIVNLLAAGNLLIKEYGMESDIEISKSGARMLDRANELIEKIVDGTLKLIDDTGALIGKQDTLNASGSNEYGDASDKGELFNTSSEIFKFKDPDQPNS